MEPSLGEVSAGRHGPVVRKALDDLPVELRKGLAEWDLAEPALIRALFDGSEEAAMEVVGQLLPGLDVETLVAYSESLVKLWDACAEPAARRVRQFASASITEGEVRACIREKDRLSQRARASARAGSMLERITPPPPGTRQLGKWPSRLRRDMALAGNERAREEAEAKDRERWRTALADIILEAGLPLAQMAEGAASPASFLRQAAQGRRATTLRKRVRDWRRARAYFLRALGRPWPLQVWEILEYVEARVSEPCRKTTLRSFHSALSFMERAGGVRTSEGFASDPLVLGALEEAALTVAGGTVKPRRPATREPVLFTVAREMIVADDEAPRYDRLYCWWQLVKTWGSLRFDDHRGMLPRDLMITANGLNGVLSRTKTSGAGKATETLPIFISSHAYLYFPDWLSVGFALWNEISDARDYFLVMPSPDRQGTIPAEVRYTDAVAISRVLLRETRCILWREGIPCWDEEPLLESLAVSLWSEHSCRASLPSWADSLAVFPKDWVDHLGRWGGDGSAGYVRTYRARAKKIQDTVALAIRRNRGETDFADEEEIFEQMARHLRAHQCAEQDILSAKERLRYFSGMSESNALTMGGRPLAGSDAELYLTGPPGALQLEPLGEVEDNGSVATSVASVPYLGGTDSEADLSTPAVAPLAQGYYVSIRPRSGYRRLHLLGACGKRPGIDYALYEYLGERCPSSDEYHDWCKHCWRAGGPVTVYDSEEESSSSSSASSTPGQGVAPDVEPNVPEEERAAGEP